MSPSTPITQAELLSELEAIENSVLFRNSKKQIELLRILIEEPDHKLSNGSMQNKLYGKNIREDERSAAGQLKSVTKRNLITYYSTEGKDSFIRIQLDDRGFGLTSSRVIPAPKTPEAPGYAGHRRLLRYAIIISLSVFLGLVIMFPMFLWINEIVITKPYDGDRIKVQSDMQGTLKVTGHGGNPFWFHYLFVSPVDGNGNTYVQTCREFRPDFLRFWSCPATIGDRKTRSGQVFEIYVSDRREKLRAGTDFDLQTGIVKEGIPRTPSGNVIEITLCRTGQECQ